MAIASVEVDSTRVIGAGTVELPEVRDKEAGMEDIGEREGCPSTHVQVTRYQ